MTVSVIYFITRIIIFKGFNGTDDMHYAMLAANMLKGRYNALANGDIFSGRFLLIAWQALFYKLGGINTFTTQAPCFIALVIACYLTVFKLLRANNAQAIVIVTALFYFNPVLTYATDGILPDVYVMLAGIITVLLFNNSIATNVAYKNILNGAGIAISASACFFFKETAVVLPILIICLTIMLRSRTAITTCLSMLGLLLVIALISGAIYYHFTGDVVFRLQQVNNSRYYNPCSYDILPASFLIIRLTYGVWKLFLTYGFYPVLFAVGIILSKLFSSKKLANLSYAAKCFLWLLAIALYIPFSFTNYQPLCSDSSRHFLFLLPFGIWVCSPYLLTDIKEYNPAKWIIITCVMFVLCILSTPDKWQWMVWALLIIFFIIQHFINEGLLSKFKFLAFVVILWLCMPYHLFYENSNWFANMRQLNKRLTGNHYYFADHDNMMHWKLLHGFNDSIYSYNMDATPYSVYKLYYNTLDTNTFNAGWLLVNTKYTERSDDFLHKVDSLQSLHYFNKQITIGDMRAYYITQPTQLAFIKNTVEHDEKIMR